MRYPSDAIHNAKKAEQTKSLNTGNKVIRLDNAASNKVLRERTDRLSTPPRDLTALILGDPLPGYSALDRVNNACG